MSPIFACSPNSSSLLVARPACCPPPRAMAHHRLWPSLLGLLALGLLIPSTRAAKESMVYPGPHPEAFRSLSLAVSLIGTSLVPSLSCPIPPPSPPPPSPISHFLCRCFRPVVLHSKENCRPPSKWSVAFAAASPLPQLHRSHQLAPQLTRADAFSSPS